MKIVIKEYESSMRFSIPLGLIPPCLAVKAVNQERSPFAGTDPKKAKDCFRVLKRFAKEHPGWVLVEVSSPDGEEVKITL